MSKLEKYLTEWVQHGLITQDQAGKIQHHENSRAESSWILTGFLILGVAIIGIGIISVIASNWHLIPDVVKLGADFAFLLSLVYALVYYWDHKKEIGFEVTLVFFMLACLASIGLISQVYHTGGKLYQAFLLWSSICLFPALTARKIYAPFLWIGMTCAGALMASYNANYETPFYRSHHAIFVTVPLICAAFVVYGKNLLHKNGPENGRENGWVSAFELWLPITGLIALFMAEIGLVSWLKSSKSISLLIPAYIIAAILIFGVWKSSNYLKSQKIILSVIAAVFLFFNQLNIMDEKSELLNALCTIVILGLFAVFLAGEKRRTLFQWLLFLVGARFLVLYFQVIGSLAMTGFGLIISGLVVIGITMLWNKYRKTLAVTAEGWLK